MWWWLSFADGERPEGDQALGVVILQAEDQWWAITLMNLLKLNPGGELAFMSIPPESIPEGKTFNPKVTYRLLSPEEAHRYAEDPAPDDLFVEAGRKLVDPDGRLSQRRADLT